MIILKTNKKNIIIASKILCQGGTIVYPTDTAYALGGIFNNKNVIKKILAIKKRKDDKFTLISSSQNQVEKFFPLNTHARKLAKKYWPGPLSLVVSRKYAVRVPDNIIARKLAQLARKPLIATSANIHRKKTPYNIKDVLRFFLRGGQCAKKRCRIFFTIVKNIRQGQELPDCILDAGTLPKRKTSTIVEVSGSRIKVIRPGALSSIASKIS